MKPVRLMAALLITFAARGAAAQNSGMRAVSGRVFDDTTGCPLRGVTVATGDGAARATTDANGRYRLRNAPTPPFSLSASLAGYRMREVDSVMASDTTARVDFSLRRDSIGAGSARVAYPRNHCQLEPRDSTR